MKTVILIFYLLYIITSFNPRYHGFLAYHTPEQDYETSEYSLIDSVYPQYYDSEDYSVSDDYYDGLDDEEHFALAKRTDGCFRDTYFRQAVNPRCPSGYMEKKDIFGTVIECLEKCPKGYFSRSDKCIEECPSGYKEFLWDNCKRNIPCPTGYDFFGCKSCPAGYKPTAVVCECERIFRRKMYNQEKVSPICPSSHPNKIGHFCYKDCKENFVEVGTSCMLRCGAQKEFPVECGALCFAHTGKCVTHSLKLGLDIISAIASAAKKDVKGSAEKVQSIADSANFEICKPN